MPYNDDGIFYADSSTPSILSEISKEQADTIGSLIAKRSYLSEIKIYNTAGTYQFNKSDYPDMTALRVRCLGGGGGGGGCSTTGASQVSIAGGGFGGDYAESFFADASLIPETNTITVGSGGTGGAAGNNNGKSGGYSFFSNIVVAAGGSGGQPATASAVPATVSSVSNPRYGTIGDIKIYGAAPSPRQYIYLDDILTPAGGGNALFYNYIPYSSITTGTNGLTPTTYPGFYGVGGGGGANCQNQATARSGGAGSNGLVILDIYTWR